MSRSAEENGGGFFSSLGLARKRNGKFLIFVDAVGVGDGGIGGGQAGPGRSTAQLGLREAPQGVALADFDRWRGAVRGVAWCSCGGGSGKIKLGADADSVGVGNHGIYGYKLRPTATTAEALLRQFPERIAGLDAHGFPWRGRKRVERLDGNSRWRGQGRNSRWRRSRQPNMSAKSWADILIKAGINIWFRPPKFWTDGHGGERIAAENI